MPNGTTHRHCANCDTEVPSRKQRFCSRTCQATAYAAKRQAIRGPRKRYTNVCLGCSSTYLTTNRHSQVCSLECRNWINPRIARTSAVPVTHPAHPQYKPWSRVSLVHSTRGTRCPVTYDACCWCDAAIVVKPSCHYWIGQLCCSKQCSRRRSKNQRRAREAGATGSFTWSQFMRLFIAGGRMCAYCDVVIDGQPDPDHVIPLSRGGSNSITNIVPACRACNSSKCDLTLTDWAARRQRLGQSPRRVVLTGPRFHHLALAETQTCRSAA